MYLYAPTVFSLATGLDSDDPN